MGLGLRALLITLIVVAVGAAAYAAVSQYNEAIAEAERWEARAESEKLAATGWKAAAGFWQKEKEKADVAITRRDRAVSEANKQTVALRADLETAKRADPALTAWANAPLPAFVVEQLRSVSADPGATERPAVKPAPQSNFWRPGTALARGNER